MISRISEVSSDPCTKGSGAKKSHHSSASFSRVDSFSVCNLAGTSAWAKGATAITKRTSTHLSEHLKLFREDGSHGRSSGEDAGRLGPRRLIKGAQQDSRHHSTVVGKRQSIPVNTIRCRTVCAGPNNRQAALGCSPLDRAAPRGISSQIRSVTARLPMSGKRWSRPIRLVLNIPAVQQ